MSQRTIQYRRGLRVRRLADGATGMVIGPVPAERITDGSAAQKPAGTPVYVRWDDETTGWVSRAEITRVAGSVGAPNYRVHWQTQRMRNRLSRLHED